MRFALGVNTGSCNCKVMEDISFHISGRQRDLLSLKIFPTLFQTHLEAQIRHASLSEVKFTPTPLIISPDPLSSVLMCAAVWSDGAAAFCCKTYNQPEADPTQTRKNLFGKQGFI